MKSICLITPGHLATNPRIVKEADSLHAAGYRVTVITGDFVAWARQADREFAGRKWTHAARLRFGPDAELFARAKQVVRQRVARTLRRAGVDTPWVLRAAWHPLGSELLQAARRIHADLYVAHYPAALPAAALAAAEHGGGYAFDAEDFHPGDTPDGAEFDATRELLRALEARYLPGCVYVTAASPGIADAYAAAYGIRQPIVVLNTFPRTNAPSQATSTGSGSLRPSVYWFSQTIGPDRGLECAVQAIGASRARPHLVLRGNAAAGFVDRLASLAKEHGVQERLHIRPPARPQEMEALAAEHDLGLVGETGRTTNRRIALTNKLFSFLLAGVPVLLSDIPAHRSIARELGPAARLYVVEDHLSLAHAIDAFLQPNVEELAAARRHAFMLGQDRFNWEREQGLLLECVSRAVGGPGHG